MMSLRNFDLSLLITHLSVVQLCTSAFQYPRLNVAVRNSGFHREIDYSIDLPKEVDCDVIIVHTLHQGIYVSNDQLNDLKRLKLLRSYVPSYINVEWPMERSSPFTVYLFSAAKSQIRIKLPIHLRYQSPGRKSFKSIPLIEPSLYLSCQNENYARLSNETFKFPCPNANEIQDVNDLPNAKSCDWFDVELISNFEGSTTISVPVGNQSLGVPVFIVTLLVAWAAAGYLIFAVLKQQKRISKKIS